MLLEGSLIETGPTLPSAEEAGFRPRRRAEYERVSCSGQRAFQLVTQVTQIFHPHRQPHQTVADPEPLAIGQWHRGMGHDRRMLDQALDSAERFGQREQLATLQHPPRLL